jgi:hypothetical protein
VSTTSIDAEAVLCTWIGQALNLPTCTELPADFAVPIVRVLGVGGLDPDYKLDAAVLDVDTFDVDYPAASATARRVHQSLRTDLRGSTVAGSLVTAVNTSIRPRWQPWDNPAVRRFTATYQVWLATA